MSAGAKLGLIVAVAALLLAILTLVAGRFVQVMDLNVTFKNAAYARVQSQSNNIILNSRIVAVFTNGGSLPARVDGLELILSDASEPRKSDCEDALWTFDLYSPPFTVPPGASITKTIETFDEVLSTTNEGIAYGELANGALPRDFLVCARLRLDGPAHEPVYSTIALSSTRVVDPKFISSTPLLPGSAQPLIHKLSLFGL